MNRRPLHLGHRGPMHALPDNVSDPRTRTPITVDQVFLDHVLDRFKWQQITLRDIEPPRSTLEEILDLLDEALDGQSASRADQSPMHAPAYALFTPALSSWQSLS